MASTVYPVLAEPSSGPIRSCCFARALIRRLSESLGVTFVIVTHDLASVFTALDRVVLLDRRAKGIIAEGDPRRLRDESDDARVRAFFRREPEEAVAACGIPSVQRALLSCQEAGDRVVALVS